MTATHNLDPDKHLTELSNKYEVAQRMTGAIYQATLEVDEGDEREALQYIHDVARMIIDLDHEDDPQVIANKLR